jgi:hypothetical protein
MSSAFTYVHMYTILDVWTDFGLGLIRYLQLHNFCLFGCVFVVVVVGGGGVDVADGFVVVLLDDHFGHLRRVRL